MGLFCLPYELLCGDFIELFLLGKGGNAFGVLLMIMDLSFGLEVLALGARGFCALGWGYICLCLFVWGGSSVLPSFQGLEVGSYSPHRVVGGD